MRRLLPSAAVLLVAAATVGFLFSSCGHRQDSLSSADTTAVRGDWVVLWELADADGLNPYTSQDASAQYIFGLMYETLLSTDVETLKDIPWIADSLPEVMPDHLHYTYRLRKNATFSDGHPVTADDFIFSLKAVKNPLGVNTAQTRNYLKSIHDAEKVNGDPYTIRFNLSEPYFLATQWTGGVYAMPKHIWDPDGITDKMPWDELASLAKAKANPMYRKYADFFEDIAKARSPKYLVSSGPYIFDTWETGQKIVLHRNETYWNAGNRWAQQWPDKLVYRVITSMDAALTALKAGEVDFMETMTKDRYTKQIDTAHGDHNLAKKDYVIPFYAALGWNMKSPLFSDSRVRWALSYAVDRKKIIEKIYYGFAEPIQSPVFNQRPEYASDLPIIPFAPAKTDSLLDLAGWKDSDGDGIRDKMVDGELVPFEFSMLVWNNPSIKNVALILSEELRKHGIKMEIEEMEWSVYLQRTRQHRFDAQPIQLVTNPTEGDLYQVYHSSQATENGSNNISFMNHTVDSLLEAIRREYDFEKRKQMNIQIQHILYDEQAGTVLYTIHNTGAYSKRFRGVKFYAPRPGYALNEWWVPAALRKYTPTNK